LIDRIMVFPRSWFPEYYLHGFVRLNSRFHASDNRLMLSAVASPLRAEA
jgi:hypothetical protein